MPARFYTLTTTTTTTSTTTTTTTPFLQFTVKVTSNLADPCMAGALSTLTVRSSNNAASLPGAAIAGATLFRMPENTLLTGYRFVGDADLANRYNIDPTTAVIGGNACD
jgi:hypothetical protein